MPGHCQYAQCELDIGHEFRRIRSIAWDCPPGREVVTMRLTA